MLPLRRLGFTIIELLVVITVIGLLAGVAVPSFQGMIEQNAHSTRVTEVYQSLLLARTQAQAYAQCDNAGTYVPASRWEWVWLGDTDADSADEWQINCIIDSSGLSTTEQTSTDTDNLMAGPTPITDFDTTTSLYTTPTPAYDTLTVSFPVGGQGLNLIASESITPTTTHTSRTCLDLSSTTADQTVTLEVIAASGQITLTYDQTCL